MVNFRSQSTQAAGKLYSSPFFWVSVSCSLLWQYIICSWHARLQYIDPSHTSLLVATTSPQLTSNPCGELGACSAVWCSTEQQRGLTSRERGSTFTPAPLFHLYFPWRYNAIQIMYGCWWISWQGLCGPTEPNQNYRRDAECQGIKGLFTL